MAETKATTTRAKAAESAKPTSIVPILSKIAAEAGALHKERDPNSGLNFAFRGVDAVINHLAPHLDEYGVITTSRITSKETSQRELFGRDGAKNGKAITQTDITVEYTFHAPDGTSVSTEVVGLAQDYADRSAAQAMSVAYRVALLQLFHLPTDDKSPEAAGEEVQRQIEKDYNNSAPKSAVPAAPKTEDIRAAIGKIIADESNSVQGEDVNKMLAELSGSSAPADWTQAHMAEALKRLREQIGAK